MAYFRIFQGGPLGTLARLLVTNGLILLCGLLTGIVTARMLGPHDRGTLAAILLWPQMFAAVGLLSVNESVLVKFAVSTSNFLEASLQAALVLAGITIGAGYLALPWLLRSSAAGELGTARVFLFLYVPANFIALVLLAAEQAQGQYSAFNRFRLLGPGAYLLGVCLLAVPGLLAVTSAATASLAGTIMVAVALLFRQRSFFSHSPSRGAVRGVIRSALPIHATAMLALASSQMDRVAVAALLEPHLLGLYTVAITVSSSVLAAIGTAAQTYLVSEVSRERTATGQREWISRGLGASWCALVATGLILVAICPLVVPLLFGEEYREAVVPTIIAVVAYVPFATRQLVVRSLRAVGENRPGQGAESIALLVFLTLLFPLRIFFGLKGIALSLLCANAGSLGFCAFQLHRHLQISPLEWLCPNPLKLWNSPHSWLRRAVV